MDTIVAKITNDSLTDKKIYEQAGKILREGGLVAVSYTHLTLPTNSLV